MSGGCLSDLDPKCLQMLSADDKNFRYQDSQKFNQEYHQSVQIKSGIVVSPDLIWFLAVCKCYQQKAPADNVKVCQYLLRSCLQIGFTVLGDSGFWSPFSFLTIFSRLYTFCTISSAVCRRNSLSSSWAVMCFSINTC